jgi:NADH dehydrogenase
VGGGFAGLYAARSLSDAPVEVTLVDRRNFHLFQPLAYQVATGGLSPAEIAAPLRSVFKRQRNARVLLAEVVGFDLEHRELAVCDPLTREPLRPVGYDTLIVAGGSSYSYFGHEEWRPHAPELKSLEGALEIRNRILGAFEKAETTDDPEELRELLTFVVVGAGPTGVEMAGQIAELARSTLREDFRHVETTRARVLLVETADRVLTSFPESLSRKAERALEQLGATPLVRHTVVDVAADAVSIEGPDGEVERIGARTVIWAAGVDASDLAALLANAAGLEPGPSGHLDVTPELTVPGHPEVFALGDMVRIRRDEGAGCSRCRASRRWRSSRAATPPTLLRAAGAASRPRGRSATATRGTWPRSAGRRRSPT